jgi:putative ABC transport system permease protein
MRHDLRFAVRMILAHRWFSAAIVVTLALGIGLNTMVFTLVNAALFKSLSLPGGARIVAVNNRNVSQGNNGMAVSYSDFQEYRAQNSSFDGLEATSGQSATVSEKGNPPQSYSMALVSSGMFEMMHIPPILGRGFLPEDDKPGAEPVLVIGYGVWKERYGSSPSVIGREVRINTKPATIIGVMPNEFKFPSNEDLWMALTPTTDLEKRSNRTLNLFGILKNGTSIPKASADLERIAQRLAAEYPDADKGIGVQVQTFQERYNGGPIRLIFLLMLAAVGFVLLIVCANVANMMLSRALGRRREISIRVAIGASRWSVIRLMLVESLLLSVIGGTLGLGLAALGVYWFDLSSQDVGKPYWVLFKMDYAVFGYFAALCLLSGLVSGLAPALRSSRVDLNTALKDGTRSVGTHRGGKLSSVLVVFQFALTLVLLMSAGIFVRAFLANQALNPWLPATQLLTARVNLPEARYADTGARERFLEQLLTRVEAIPGVTNAAITSSEPEMGAGSRHIEIEDMPVADSAHGPSAAFVAQSPGYFSAINLPLLRGRDFNETDGGAGKLAAVVTREFAARFWPNQEAVGKRFRFYDDDKPGDWISVVGVSADIVQQSNRNTHDPLLFLPYRQEGYGGMALVVRSAGNPSPLVPAIRAALQNMDQDLPLQHPQTVAAEIYHNQWYLRLFGVLFIVFALIALLIASVGIYAVIAQATSSRTQEIGVRMALGASSRNILMLILTRGMKQLIAGLVLGLVAAYPAAKLMSTLPLRVAVSDPILFLSISALLASVGLFACWLPARRAAGLDPVKAIRYE